MRDGKREMIERKMEGGGGAACWVVLMMSEGCRKGEQIVRE